MATTYDPSTADLGTVQRIPFDKLVIDPNVRRDIRLDKSFVSSVRVNGFLLPPVGYTDDDGLTHITIGQRRVSAALEIGWPVIPVLVKPRVDAEQDRVEELRVLAQLTENEQRTGLTPAEIAGGYKTLALIGLTEERIARKTNTPRARVETALKVEGSQVAAAALTEHGLTLDQAAILVEFEHDKKALAALRETADRNPAHLEHAAQQHRSRIARERHGQSVADKARAEGWEVIVRKDNDGLGYGIPAGMSSVRDLCRVGDKKRAALTTEDIAELPGRVVIIDPRFNGVEADVIWCLRNPAKHGFQSRHAYDRSVKAPLTDKEKAERKQKRVDKTEMTDATVVRRTWIRDVLLQGKVTLTAHAGWIVAIQFELDSAFPWYQARTHEATVLACELLGVTVATDEYGQEDLDATIARARADGADSLYLLLALAIARVEHPAGNPKSHAYGQDKVLGPYLLQLQAWGYQLADVEQRIVTAHTKEQARKRAAS